MLPRTLLSLPVLLAACSLLPVGVPSLARAQPAAQPSPTPPPLTQPSLSPSAPAQPATVHTLAVAANVLGLATLNPTLDLELALTRQFTLGATAWWEVREVQDRWGQLRLSWYPGGQALRGFALALTGGVHRAWDEPGGQSATSGTAGLLAGYDFRFGPSGQVLLGIVAGAKATFTDHGDDSPLQPVYAEARLDLGWVL